MPTNPAPSWKVSLVNFSPGSATREFVPKFVEGERLWSWKTLLRPFSRMAMPSRTAQPLLPLAKASFTHNLPKRAQEPLVPLSAGDITGTGRTEQTIYHGILTQARSSQQFLRKIRNNRVLPHAYE